MIHRCRVHLLPGPTTEINTRQAGTIQALAGALHGQGPLSAVSDKFTDR